MEYSLSTAAAVYTAARVHSPTPDHVFPARGGAKDAEEQQRASRGVSAVVIVADVRKHWNPFTFPARGNPAPRGAHNRVTRRCKFSKEFLRVIRFRARAPLLSSGMMSGAAPEGFSLKFVARKPMQRVTLDSNILFHFGALRKQTSWGYVRKFENYIFSIIFLSTTRQSLLWNITLMFLNRDIDIIGIKGIKLSHYKSYKNLRID